MKTTDSLVDIVETLMRNQIALQDQLAQLADAIAITQRDISLLQSDVRVLVDERGQAKNKLG